MTLKEKRLIKADDLYDIQVITDCQISPNGKEIVYAIQSIERDSEKKFTHLWKVPTSGGDPVQLTFGKQVDTHPKWSPDGNWLAFYSNRLDKEQTQLFVLPVAGGESRPLTDLRGDLGEFNWSPDSQKIVFEFRQQDAEDVAIKEDDKKQKLGRVSRRVTDRIFYKYDGYGFLPKSRFHLWTVEVQSKELNQLTDSPVHEELEPVWSPDGKKILFFSNRTDTPDLNPDAIDLFLLDVDDKSIEKIETPAGPKRCGSFSPNGKQIAYFGYEGLEAGYKNTEVWLLDLGEPQSARSLTAGFDANVGAGVINDVGAVMISPPTWSADGETIYFQVGSHGRTTLHKVAINGDALETVLKFDGVVSAFSLDAQSKQIAYIHGTMTDPCQVAVLPLGEIEPERLTKLNRALLDEVDLGSTEEVWFKGAGDNDLQGWIVKPPNFDPEKKYPSILEIHGGPRAQYGFFFMHEFFYLAAQGYIVYFCNPRGGQGYGEAHTKAIFYGKWGTVDYDDLMVWADWIEKKPYIDPDRMGVTGGSYGGYMTVWIIGHTDRFKGAVSQRCVSNLVSMWGSSDFNWSFQTIFDDKAPYESIETIWECSPMKHLGSASTPTLVIHSMQDLRCALEQSEQVYVALKKLQVDTEFLMFPDSPHGISRMGRTDRRIVRLEAIREWFDRYLLG